MIKIEIKDGNCSNTCEGSKKDLSVETVIIVQTLARAFAKMNSISEIEAIDVIADSAKHFQDKLETMTVEGTEIYIPGDKK